MKRTLSIFCGAAALLVVSATACTDPTVAPKSSISGANVFNDPNSYRDFIAKIYGGLILTGQGGGATEDRESAFHGRRPLEPDAHPGRERPRPRINVVVDAEEPGLRIDARVTGDRERVLNRPEQADGLAMVHERIAERDVVHPQE